jgi:hypothetical protein
MFEKMLWYPIFSGNHHPNVNSLGHGYPAGMPYRTAKKLSAPWPFTIDLPYIEIPRIAF